MMRGATVFAAVLVLAATGASAKDEDGETQTEQATKEKKICKTEKVTGSLTRRRRICMTEAQWRELDQRTRTGVNQMGSDASGGHICHPNPLDPAHGCN